MSVLAQPRCSPYTPRSPLRCVRISAPALILTLSPTAQLVAAGAAGASALQARYGVTVDRESAYEQLAARLAPPEPEPPAAELPPLPPATGLPPMWELPDIPPMPEPVRPAELGLLDKVMDSPAFKSAMRSAGTVIGREITRSILGTGRRRRR